MTPAAIFVGGVQRSGTHALAALIGAHSRFAAIPRELAFHADPGGLPGVIDGTISPAELVRRMRGPWWRRETYGVTRGLFKSIPRDRLDRALETFEPAAATDPVAAGARLLRAIADPFADGAAGWVEMTPTTATWAGSLVRMLPDLRLVHVVRDGRDVACSIAALPWGPATPEKGLRFWAERLRAADEGARAIPPEQLHVIRLEELVLLDRERAYQRLLAFLGVADEPGMRAFFEAEITPGKAHTGRWRAELSPDDGERLTRDYHALLVELSADGVSCVPEPEPLPAAVPGFAREAATSAVDPWADGRAADA